MSGYYGLIELLLVFGIVLGWGLWELRSARKYKAGLRRKEDLPADEKDRL